MSKLGTLPAGKYYIGDLCYVMHDEWSDVCDLMFAGDINSIAGMYTLNNKVFAVDSTAYGDGCYNDNYGSEYSVDAGLIGIIALKDINLSADSNFLSGGQVHTFEQAFSVHTEDGVFQFGHVRIDTADEQWECEECGAEVDEGETLCYICEEDMM